MAGNVWEWDEDVYVGSYEGASTEGAARTAGGPKRVRRGGCWLNTAEYLRAATRGADTPESRRGCLGFRLVVL